MLAYNYGTEMWTDMWTTGYLTTHVLPYVSRGSYLSLASEQSFTPNKSLNFLFTDDTPLYSQLNQENPQTIKRSNDLFGYVSHPMVRICTKHGPQMAPI